MGLPDSCAALFVGLSSSRRTAIRQIQKQLGEQLATSGGFINLVEKIGGIEGTVWRGRVSVKRPVQELFNG